MNRPVEVRRIPAYGDYQSSSTQQQKTVYVDRGEFQPPPFVSLRQTYAAPSYREASPLPQQYQSFRSQDDSELYRLQEELRYSRQEEMRLKGLLAAKESVVQKNQDAIRFFREAMVQRDQEMRNILVEEETQLKNLAAEYKQRFDRERENLKYALMECERCTKVISEILPECIRCHVGATEILAGKPINEVNLAMEKAIQPAFSASQPMLDPIELDLMSLRGASKPSKQFDESAISPADPEMEEGIL